MRKQLNIEGISQYDDTISEALRSSACGPVTARILMNQFSPDACPYGINELFKLLGGTKIGLLKRRFIRNMRKILGANWLVDECKLEEVKLQIDEGRVVAAKFDKWLNFRWFGQFEFDYHWVPVIGYEKIDNDIILFIHDNGSRNQASQVRKVSFRQNRPILSFVKIEPLQHT